MAFPKIICLKQMIILGVDLIDVGQAEKDQETQRENKKCTRGNLHYFVPAELWRMFKLGLLLLFLCLLLWSSCYFPFGPSHCLFIYCIIFQCVSIGLDYQSDIQIIKSAEPVLCHLSFPIRIAKRKTTKLQTSGDPCFLLLLFFNVCFGKINQDHLHLTGVIIFTASQNVFRIIRIHTVWVNFHQSFDCGALSSHFSISFLINFSRAHSSSLSSVQPPFIPLLSHWMAWVAFK